MTKKNLYIKKSTKKKIIKNKFYKITKRKNNRLTKKGGAKSIYSINNNNYECDQDNNLILVKKITDTKSSAEKIKDIDKYSNLTGDYDAGSCIEYAKGKFIYCEKINGNEITFVAVSECPDGSTEIKMFPEEPVEPEPAVETTPTPTSAPAPIENAVEVEEFKPLIDKRQFYEKIEKKYAIIVFLQAFMSLFLKKGNLTNEQLKSIPNFCGEIYLHLYNLYDSCFDRYISDMPVPQGKEELLIFIEENNYNEFITKMLEYFKDEKLKDYFNSETETEQFISSGTRTTFETSNYRMGTSVSKDFQLEETDNEFISNHKIDRMFIEDGEINIEVCKKRLEAAAEKIGNDQLTQIKTEIDAKIK